MQAILSDPQNLQVLTVFALITILWIIPWKGYALWLAARNYHKGWFIILLILNTLAILDIIYIFMIGRPEYQRIQEEENTTE